MIQPRDLVKWFIHVIQPMIPPNMVQPCGLVILIINVILPLILPHDPAMWSIHMVHPGDSANDLSNMVQLRVYL